ncbi:MAG: hypothetical protein M3400_10440 [Actinomycetota bacterium]|nr:hypothetical protein [Actinomycetota bacterium]
MTTVLSEPGLSGLAQARDVVRAAAETELWSLTDRQLAAELADAVALRAQADAVLLARVGEAEARGLAAPGVRRRWSGGCAARTACQRPRRPDWSGPPGPCAGSSRRPPRR